MGVAYLCANREPIQHLEDGSQTEYLLLPVPVLVLVLVLYLYLSCSSTCPVLVLALLLVHLLMPVLVP